MLDADLLRAAGIEEEWVEDAYICTNCDWIWAYNSEGKKDVKGYFGGNGLVEAENWIPYRRL